MKGRKSLQYREGRDDGSERSEFFEPDNAVSCARRAESSLDSGSACRVHGRVSYSKKKFSVAVAKVTSSFHVAEDLTTKRNEYACFGFCEVSDCAAWKGGE